jgi:cysteinyl-tRNA synthetase
MSLGLEGEKATNSSNDKRRRSKYAYRHEESSRADKNFALSDQIRDQLVAFGIQLKMVKKVPLLVFNRLTSSFF